MKLISAGDLGPAHVGRLVRYDNDAPTVYGGQRPHPDGQSGHLLVVLDGREVDGWDFDDVWETE